MIAVIGANGRSGRVLCHALLGLGYRVIAVVRNTQTLEPDIAWQSYAVRQADLTQQDTLGTAQQGASLVIAGPEAVTYSTFIRMIFSLAGMKQQPVFAVPVWLLLAASYVMRFIPGLPRIEAAEVRRLTENKNFNIELMKEKLNIDPIPLERGLKELFDSQCR